MTTRINSRYEALLFDLKTTQRTDYQFVSITNPNQTVYQPKPRKPRPPYPGLKNHYTFDVYNGLIPFSLLHKPKDIVRTNPHDRQETSVTPVDEGHLQAQKTRPRLYIAPGVSIDDVEDPAERELVVNDVYATSCARAIEKSAAAATKMSANRAPLAERPAAARPIRLPPYQPPVVPEEWRMETLSWEGRQLRSWVDPTCIFWLTRKTERKATDSNAKKASVGPTHEKSAPISSPLDPIENKNNTS